MATIDDDRRSGDMGGFLQWTRFLEAEWVHQWLTAALVTMYEPRIIAFHRAGTTLFLGAI